MCFDTPYFVCLPSLELDNFTHQGESAATLLLKLHKDQRLYVFRLVLSGFVYVSAAG